MKRYALVTLAWERDNPEPYMPGNYRVVHIEDDPSHVGWRLAVVEGEDRAGWTLDDYVLPRLASGGMHGREIDLSHEVMTRVPTCLEARSGECAGLVEYRMPLSGTGRAFPRCDHHWARRLDEQERINRTYPATAPSDFDPSYAGEKLGRGMSATPTQVRELAQAIASHAQAIADGNTTASTHAVALLIASNAETLVEWTRP